MYNSMKNLLRCLGLIIIPITLFACSKDDLPQAHEKIRNDVKEISVTGEVSDILPYGATIQSWSNLQTELLLVAKVGVILSKNENPTHESKSYRSLAASSIGSDNSYTVYFDDLDPGETYYYRSYVNLNGTYKYGKVYSFKTSDADVSFKTEVFYVDECSARVKVDFSLGNISKYLSKKRIALNLYCSGGEVMEYVDNDFEKGQCYFVIDNLRKDREYFCRPYISVGDREVDGDGTYFTTREYSIPEIRNISVEFDKTYLYFVVRFATSLNVIDPNGKVRLFIGQRTAEDKYFIITSYLNQNNYCCDFSGEGTVNDNLLSWEYGDKSGEIVLKVSPHMGDENSATFSMFDSTYRSYIDKIKAGTITTAEKKAYDNMTKVLPKCIDKMRSNGYLGHLGVQYDGVDYPYCVKYFEIPY